MASITTRYLGDMLFETRLGNHRLCIDVPASMGGNDRGPTPPELFIASLGSCIGAFVAQYCVRAGINVRGLNVVVTYEKTDNPTHLINLRAIINLPYGEVGEREDAILRVAEHCPVQETINLMDGLALEIIDAGGVTVA